MRGNLTRFFKETVFAAFLQVGTHEAAKGVERSTTTHWRQVLPPGHRRIGLLGCAAVLARAGCLGPDMALGSLEYITAPMEGTGEMAFEVP